MMHNSQQAPGRRILVEIKLPTGRPLEAIGRIAWVKRVLSPNQTETESGIGVEFLGGANEQFKALEEYLSDDDATANSGGSHS